MLNIFIFALFCSSERYIQYIKGRTSPLESIIESYDNSYKVECINEFQINIYRCTDYQLDLRIQGLPCRHGSQAEKEDD